MNMARDGNWWTTVIRAFFRRLKRLTFPLTEIGYPFFGGSKQKTNAQWTTTTRGEMD